MDAKVKNKMLLNLRRYVQQEKAGHQNKLFDYQILALDRIVSFLAKPKGAEYGIAFTDDEDGKEETGRKKGDFFEIISATGTGKTRMFGCLAEACNVPTLILTPRKVINKDTRKEFCKEIGIDENDVGVYDSSQSRSKKEEAFAKRYLITTYQSLPALMRNGSDFSDKRSSHYRPLVILDEMHKGQGFEQSKSVQKIPA